MKRRRWWIGGVALALVAACVGGWWLLKPSATLPKFLKPFEHQIVARAGTREEEPIEPVIFSAIYVDEPMERIALAAVKDLGADTCAFSKNGSEGLYFHPTRMDNWTTINLMPVLKSHRRLTRVLLIEQPAKPLSPVDGMMAHVWGGWIDYRFGGHGPWLYDDETADKSFDWQKLRDRLFREGVGPMSDLW